MTPVPSQASPSFTLYITGDSESARSEKDLVSKALARLGGQSSFEVVDVLENPGRAETDRILTTPMLVRWTPGPVQRLVGDVTDADIARLLETDGDADEKNTGPPLLVDRSSEVLSRAAHELRTPLAVIRGFAAILQTSLQELDHEVSKKSADAIVRSSIQLQALIDSMLVIEAVETDGIRLDLSDWELGDIALETIRDLQPLLARHEVRTSIRDGVWVRVDAAKIRQVLTNLLTNAVKFSEAGTGIRVSVVRKDSMGYVLVEDNGKGIPHDDLEALFAKYERLGSGEKGTGLGLYIARSLARAHGGNLKAYSDGGSGSRFELALPLLAD